MCRKTSRSSGVSLMSITGSVASGVVSNEMGCGVLNMSLNTGDV